MSCTEPIGSNWPGGTTISSVRASANQAKPNKLLDQAEPRLLQLLLRNLDPGDRLTDYHLFHQGLEQAEATEQGPTLNADRSRQLRNHRSAIHVSQAIDEN